MAFKTPIRASQAAAKLLEGACGNMLGEALRLIRVFHDYKLVELAEKLDVSQGYLSEVENLKKKPAVELLQKYADEFCISMSAIMVFAEELWFFKKFHLEAGPRDKMRAFLGVVERGI